MCLHGIDRSCISVKRITCSTRTPFSRNTLPRRAVAPWTRALRLGPSKNPVSWPSTPRLRSSPSPPASCQAERKVCLACGTLFTTPTLSCLTRRAYHVMPCLSCLARRGLLVMPSSLCLALHPSLVMSCSSYISPHFYRYA